MTPDREVVACVLTHDDDYLLLRRSPQVGSDQGRWHCITGYGEVGVAPLDQALTEVAEETGLRPGALRLVRQFSPLVLTAPGGDWTVHLFHFSCARRDVVLNWENDQARWLARPLAAGLDTVDWLATLLHQVSPAPEPVLCD